MNSPYKIRLYGNFHENLRKNEIKNFINYITIALFSYLPDEDDKKVDVKNEEEDEKIWKNEFGF